MEQVTKKDLIMAMATSAGLSQEKAKKAIEGLLTEIRNSLEKGKKIAILDFGTFEVKTMKARTGRNLNTGEALEIPEKNTVKFRPGKGLVEAVNGSKKAKKNG